MNPFEALIEELKQVTGLPLEVSQENSCSLENDGLVITMQYRQSSDDLVLFSPILMPEENEELSPEVMKRALELAYNGDGTRGGFLGLFEGSLVLSVFLPLEDLDAGGLATRILAFTETAQGVLAELEELPARDEDNDEASGASDEELLAKDYLQI